LNPDAALRASEIELNLNLMAGFNYVLQTSSDLTNWQNLGESFFVEDEYYSLKVPINGAKQFFRAYQLR